ncbi:MAG: HAD family hydrolase [Clostridiales bacterium]|nr:HAD family hydrolase [Clostridiales bacterium]
MKEYRYIIFDADQTLIDFFEDERRAIRAVFSAIGKQASGEQVADIRRFSDENWVELGLFEVHTAHVQQNFHALYYRHLEDVVNYAAEKYSFEERREAAGKVFFETLCRPATLFPDALDTVKVLSERYRICIATNGIAKMQRGRLAPFSPYVSHLLISEEMGAIKPSGAFFADMLRILCAKASECLMVGDSISSDIAGATAAGMDSILLDRTGINGQSPAICTVSSLHELLEL